MKYLLLVSITISLFGNAQKMPSQEIVDLFPEVSMDFTISQLNFKRFYDDSDFSLLGEYGEIIVDSSDLITANLTGLDTLFTGGFRAPSRFYAIGKMQHKEIKILLYLEENYTENRNSATYTDVNQLVKASVFNKGKYVKTFVFFEETSFKDYSVNYYTYITNLTSFDVLNDDLVHVKLYSREMWVEEYFGDMDEKMFNYLRNAEVLTSYKIEEDGTLTNLSN